jgi:TolB protein
MVVIVATPSVRGAPASAVPTRGILFSTGSAIYSVPASGGHPRRIISGGDANRHPAWSPDGRKIAFDSNRSGNYDVWVYNTATHKSRNVTHGGFYDADPAWSPDGKHLVFVTTRSGNLDLAVVRLSSGKVHRITSFAGDDMQPSWAPTGDRIAFTSDRGNSDDIFTVRRNGSGLDRVAAGQFADAYPTWSPDGTHIAYEAYRSGSYDIRVVSATGKGDRGVATGGAFDGYPAWGPDGTSVVFSSNRGGGLHLWVKPLSGKARQLTYGSGSDVQASWAYIPRPCTGFLQREQVDNAGPRADRLAAVAALGEHDAWAVGYRTTAGGVHNTLVERRSGGSWQVVPSPSRGGASSLESVSLLSSTVWAVGSYADGDGALHPLIERRERSWRVARYVDPGPGSALHGVDARTSKDVWAVGQLAGNAGPDSLIEHFDGFTWSVVPGAPAGIALFGVVALSPSDVWAVGSSAHGKKSSVPALAHFDGSRWTIETLPGTGTLRAITSASSGGLWAVGYTTSPSGRRALIAHYDGTAWTIVPGTGLPTTTASALYGVAATGSTDVWAVGTQGSGKVRSLAERYRGGQWKPARLPKLGPRDSLQGVAALASGSVWAVGSRGQPARTVALHRCRPSS